jgi:hypothetical protein
LSYLKEPILRSTIVSCTKTARIHWWRPLWILHKPSSLIFKLKLFESSSLFWKIASYLAIIILIQVPILLYVVTWDPEFLLSCNASSHLTPMIEPQVHPISYTSIFLLKYHVAIILPLQCWKDWLIGVLKVLEGRRNGGVKGKTISGLGGQETVKKRVLIHFFLWLIRK